MPHRCVVKKCTAGLTIICNGLAMNKSHKNINDTAIGLGISDALAHGRFRFSISLVLVTTDCYCTQSQPQCVICVMTISE